MPITLDAHLQMVRAATDYRDQLQKIENLVNYHYQNAKDNGNPAATTLATIYTAIHSISVELRAEYNAPIQFAHTFYTKARIKRNGQERDRQREQRLTAGMIPRDPPGIVKPDPIYSAPKHGPELEEASEETKERYAAWLKSMGEAPSTE